MKLAIFDLALVKFGEFGTTLVQIYNPQGFSVFVA